MEYKLYSFQNELSRCRCIVTYDPISAITSMEALRAEAFNSILYEDLWNYTAKIINTTIISIQKSKYYNKNEYWGQHQPTLLELMEYE